MSKRFAEEKLVPPTTKQECRAAMNHIQQGRYGAQQYAPWLQVRETLHCGTGVYAKVTIPADTYPCDYASSDMRPISVERHRSILRQLLVRTLF
ncbi:hypothetical protein L596_023448 [Steinernema carpocapsae]|uniref:Uncharacterized protein n=1 Tax=Steinernema carpocapsae TaxID=34508 RepID=A0A4U5MDQ5_STECR|nr:hypothetical protein L596_023448 [Steinernema carpocapsae]